MSSVQTSSVSMLHSQFMDVGRIAESYMSPARPVRTYVRGMGTSLHINILVTSRYAAPSWEDSCVGFRSPRWLLWRIYLLYRESAVCEGGPNTYVINLEISNEDHDCTVLLKHKKWANMAACSWWHLQMHILERKNLCFDWNSTEVYSLRSYWK